MIEQPTYSIIIPHKNIPKLLQRCLDSIPPRDDIQIIVVDDNSDSDRVDFAKFPGLDDPRVEIIFTKEGKGAGYARNVGLSRVRGKWLLFADADDFYNYCITDILDDYKDSDADIVFCNCNGVDTETYGPVDRGADLRSHIETYGQEKNKGIDLLRYHFHAPWSRIIKSALVEEYNIRFDETIINNDFSFSFQIGFYARAIEVDKRALYCITFRADSIQGSAQTAALGIEQRLAKIYVYGKCSVFCRAQGLKHSFTEDICELLLEIYFKDRENYAKAKNILSEVGDANEKIKRTYFLLIIRKIKEMIREFIRYFIPWGALALKLWSMRKKKLG